jgi:hypothetical protein
MGAKVRCSGSRAIALALAFQLVACAKSEPAGGNPGTAGVDGVGGAGGSAALGSGGAGGSAGTAGVAGSLGTGTAGAGASGTTGTAGASGTTGAGGSGACDPLSNAGCAAGTKCTVLQTPTSFALGCGSKGGKTAGAACTPTGSGQMQTGDDCADGMACFALQGETTPSCRQFCMASGATGACPTGMTCSLQVTDLPGRSFCRATTSCTLVPQTGCPTGQACYLIPTGATCAPAGRVAPGAACVSANDCAAGSSCITTTGVSSCASYCSLTGGTPACAPDGTGGTACTATPGTPPEPTTGICR